MWTGALYVNYLFCTLVDTSGANGKIGRLISYIQSMVSTRKMLTVGVAGALAISLSGCTWFAPKPTREPLAMIQAGVTNFAAKMSSDYSVKFDATLLGKDADNKAQNVVAHLDLAGDTNSDPAAMALNTKIRGNMSVNADKYTIDTELRANKSAIFAILTSLTGPDADIPKEYVAQAAGKWWKIPVPEALVKTYLPGGDASGALDAGSAVSQRLKDAENIFKNVSGYVKDVTYDGADTIGGLKSYRYTASLDNPKIKEFMIQYNNDKGTEPTAEDLKKLDDFLAQFTSKLTLWVSVDGEILDRVKGEFVMNKVMSDDGKSSGKGNVSFDMTYSNFGKNVVVAEPADAQTFDLFSMLGGYLGAAGESAALEEDAPEAKADAKAVVKPAVKK